MVGHHASEYARVRNRIIRTLKRDTIGPGWKEGTDDPDLQEVIGISPVNTYLTGYLEPKGMVDRDTIPVLSAQARVERDESDTEGATEPDNEDDDSTEGQLLLSPSSMGITFCT